MKLLAVTLAVILVILVGVCFFLPEGDTQQPTDGTDTISTEQSSETATSTPADSSAFTEPSQVVTTSPVDTTVAETDTVPVIPLDTDFVRVADHVPNLRVELAYATENNFTETVIYEFTDAYLRYGTVKKLCEAAKRLEDHGYGILIWDAYRPDYAQQMLWDICPDPTYVSKPGTGSQSHCRGIAVDVTLYDLETGELLEMPTGFDDFSALADRDYSDCSESARNNAVLLETIMSECGFKPYSGEWWHFADTDTYDIESVFDPAQAG